MVVYWAKIKLFPALIKLFALKRPLKPPFVKPKLKQFVFFVFHHNNLTCTKSTNRIFYFCIFCFYALKELDSSLSFSNVFKYYQASVWSTMTASGAFFITEAIPFFMLSSLAYIWLEPMIWPLVAIKLK